MQKSPKDKHEAAVKNLLKKTGKTLEQWVELVRKKGPPERADKIKWLQIKFNFPNEHAKMIVKHAHNGVEDHDDEELMNKYFNNGKDYQKEIWEKIISVVKKFGKQTVAVNKTYLSLNRNQQFAIVKATREGLVIGVPGSAVRKAKSKDFVSSKNLGSAKITHKTVLNDVSDVTDSVVKVLKASYDKC